MDKPKLSVKSYNEKDVTRKVTGTRAPRGVKKGNDKGAKNGGKDNKEAPAAARLMIRKKIEYSDDDDLMQSD